MSLPVKDSSYFSSLCVERCGGACCDPWWGIISFSVVKKGGLSDLRRFKEELSQGITSRARRITEAYVTSEVAPRPLFGSPQRYCVKLKGVKASGTTLELNLLAMFAFRCRFLSEDKTCGIHPALLGGSDIRPPHCGYMGSPEARYGEKGYCRIIHAAVAEPRDEEAISRAIETERGASEKSFSAGFPTAGEAAEALLQDLVRYCTENLSHLLPRENASAKAGRNDPCPCGSGRKYKKCHGN